jgi:hypothetical protein
MSYRQPTSDSLAAQAALLERETNEAVARALLENLWAGRDTSRDTVLAVLAHVAKHHPLASIQQAAQRMLSASVG